MHENRHLRRGSRKPAALLCAIVFAFSSCAVYTIDKSQLTTRLNPRDQNCCKTGSLNKVLAMQKYQYNNRIDTLSCFDETGKVKIKKLNFDSKVTVITTDNKAIKLYAKTLYIWKDEFLIGERISPSFRNPSYYPIKLKNISRIEVRG